VVNGTARVRVYGYVRVRAKFRGQMSGKANVLHCEMTKTARLSSWARASDRSRQRGVDDEHCAPSVPLSNGIASRRVARYKSPQESLATSFPYLPFPRRLFLFRVSDRGAEAQSVVGMVAGRFVFFYCSLG